MANCFTKALYSSHSKQRRHSVGYLPGRKGMAVYFGRPANLLQFLSLTIVLTKASLKSKEWNSITCCVVAFV